MKFLAIAALLSFSAAVQHRHHHHHAAKPRLGSPEAEEKAKDEAWRNARDGAGRQIYDKDGDGVEDNVHRTREELDRFYLPNNFHPVEDIYNTKHGNLPGHVRKSEYEGRPNYKSAYFHPELSDGKHRTASGLETRGDGKYEDVFGQNGLAQRR